MTGAAGGAMQNLQGYATEAQQVGSILQDVYSYTSEARARASQAAAAAREGTLTAEDLKEDALNQGFLMFGAMATSMLTLNPIPILAAFLGMLVEKIILADEWNVGYASMQPATCAENQPCTPFEQLDLACKLSFEDWRYWALNASHPNSDDWEAWIREKTGHGQARVLSQWASWPDLPAARKEEFRDEWERIRDDDAYALELYRARADVCLAAVYEEASARGDVLAIVAAEKRFGGRYIDGAWHWGEEIFDGVPIGTIPTWIPLDSSARALLPQYWYAWRRLGLTQEGINRIAELDPLIGVAPPGTPYETLDPIKRQEVYANAAVIAAAAAGAHEQTYEEAILALFDLAGQQIDPDEIRGAWDRLADPYVSHPTSARELPAQWYKSPRVIPWVAAISAGTLTIIGWLTYRSRKRGKR